MKFYSKIKNDLRKFKLELSISSKKLDDTYSMAIVQSLLNNRPYLPINGGALRPFCLAYVLNEIIIGQRKSIIEFGSGMSTILIARLIKENNISARFISVEHNKEWIGVLKSQLQNEGLSEIVEIIHTDLVVGDTELGEVTSYDFDKIKKEIFNIKFDLIIVDGPPANTETSKYSRFPILLELRNHLFDDFCFLLDDAERSGEKKTINEYRRIYPTLKFSLIGKTLGVFRSKEGFNPIPVYYSTRK